MSEPHRRMDNMDQPSLRPEELTPTSGCTITSLGPVLIVIGGWNPSYEDPFVNSMDPHYVRKIYKYNLYTGVWSELSCFEDALNSPVETACHSTFYVNGKILMLGGSLSSLGVLQSSNKIYRYNIFHNSWQEEGCSNDNDNAPPTNVGHWWGRAAALDGDVVITATGDKMTNSMVINQLRMSSNDYRWERIDPVKGFSLDHPLVKHQTVVYDNKIFVFGGLTNFDYVRLLERPPFSLSHIPTFDLNNRKWTTTNCTGPEEILDYWPFAASAVLVDHFVFLTGGKLFNGVGGSEVCDKVLRLDLIERQWEVFAKMKQGRYFHASCVTSDGCICIYGGCIDESYSSGRRSNQLEFVHCSVPRLQTLAMRAFVPMIADSVIRKIKEDQGTVTPRNILTAISRYRYDIPVFVINAIIA